MDQEERMARTETVLSQPETSLAKLISEIESLKTEMVSALRELKSEIRQLRLWMIGILIPMWVSIILTIIFTRSIR